MTDAGKPQEYAVTVWLTLPPDWWGNGAVAAKHVQEALERAIPDYQPRAILGIER